MLSSTSTSSGPSEHHAFHALHPVRVLDLHTQLEDEEDDEDGRDDDNEDEGEGEKMQGEEGAREERHRHATVVKVSAGFAHTAALTSSGRLYTWCVILLRS